MSTSERDDIAGVDQEVRERQKSLPAPGWYATAACQIILEARRERDAAIRENERWKRGDQIESDYLTQADMQTLAIINERDALRVERDMALARETDWESEHAKLSELHDADVRRLTAEVRLRAAEAEHNADLADDWHKVADERAAELARVTADRDAALDDSARWHAAMQDALARVQELKAKVAWVDDEHAKKLLVATDRIAVLEEQVSHPSYMCRVEKIRALHRRMQVLEADLDTEVRRRDEFAREAAELEERLAEAQARGAENDRLREAFEDAERHYVQRYNDMTPTSEWSGRGLIQRLRAALAAKKGGEMSKCQHCGREEGSYLVCCEKAAEAWTATAKPPYPKVMLYSCDLCDRRMQPTPCEHACQTRYQAKESDMSEKQQNIDMSAGHVEGADMSERVAQALRLLEAFEDVQHWDAAVDAAADEWDADAASASIGIERYRKRLEAALTGKEPK